MGTGRNQGALFFVPVGIKRTPSLPIVDNILFLKEDIHIPLTPVEATY